MTRYHLDRCLQELKDEICRMGGMVEESVENAFIALKNLDTSLADSIISKDDEVDDIENRIEKKCLSLFALQQPLARDLRFIGSSLKMITDLERIADHSADISELTLRLAQQKPAKISDSIFEMAGTAKSMVRRSIDAFIGHDTDTANAVCKDDDIVDKMFNDIIMDIAGRFKSGDQSVDVLIDTMFIVKYIERMADHATNISEWVVYNETGKHEHLQHPEYHKCDAEEQE